ncbi:MAG: acetolactate decarboxylase [Gammaproteobacteria bacterium]|nr:acetolactate decarboxylase [Gammaproteobacteria bacterium]
MAQLYQYSHFLAVNRGLYDGELSIGALKQHGNVGLGTFNALDGELVIVDGEFYQCTDGNNVRQAASDTLLPWAAVSSFTAACSTQKMAHLSDISKLELQLLELIQSKNYPYLFRIKGAFNNIKITTVPKQQKPYVSIETVIEQSLQIDTGTITADLVGFYAPDFMFPIKGKGLHLHCITSDKEYGGHVLDLDLINAEVCFEKITDFQIELPKQDEYKNMAMAAFQDDEHVPLFEDKLDAIPCDE